jgi:hypothetical protein
MWYAGMDWADQHHDVVVIEEKGQQVKSLRIAHSPKGFASLNTFFPRVAQRDYSK